MNKHTETRPHLSEKERLPNWPGTPERARYGRSVNTLGVPPPTEFRGRSPRKTSRWRSSPSICPLCSSPGGYPMQPRFGPSGPRRAAPSAPNQKGTLTHELPDIIEVLRAEPPSQSLNQTPQGGLNDCHQPTVHSLHRRRWTRCLRACRTSIYDHRGRRHTRLTPPRVPTVFQRPEPRSPFFG